MRIIFYSLLVFLLSVTQSSLASIEVRSKQISIADGLANNTVRCIMQDSKGFIWLGTLNGLNRYDGNSFQSYYPSHEDEITLANRKIYGIDEDSNGFLWIYSSAEQYSCYDPKRSRFVDFTGSSEMYERYSKKLITQSGDIWLWHTENGARRVIFENGQFRSIVYKKENNKTLSNQIRFVGEGLDGCIWLASYPGLIRIKGEKEELIDNQEILHHMVLYEGETYFCSSNNQIFKYNPATASLDLKAQFPASSSIATFLEFHSQWFILTSEGTYAYDFATEKIRKAPELFGEEVRSPTVSVDNKGNYWVYNHSGKIWYLNNETGKTKIFRLIPEEKMGFIDAERYQIIQDSRDIIWISTYGNGLYAYDIAKDELTHFTAERSGISHIGSDYLMGVMEDRSGEIWVSSEFLGLSKISIINEGVHRYFPESPSALDRSNTIRLAARIDDEIWIGTRQGGLSVYDLDFNLKHSRKDLKTNIYAMVKDSEGKIWMGSRGEGLSIDNVWHRRQDNDNSSLANDNIFCLFRDSKDRMWVGTFNGGLDLAVKKNGKYRFRHFLNKTYGQRQIRTICEDDNGMIWVGTSEGVYIFDPESLIVDSEHYHHYNYTNGNLNSDEIKYIYKDSRGNILVSTSGTGFSICSNLTDYNALQFDHFDVRDGLCNNVIQSITEDEQGNIWLGTEYGLSKFILSEKQFENYYLSAYTEGNVFGEGSVCHAGRNTLLFGTNYGFIVFNTEDIRNPNHSSYPIVFTNLNVNGSDVLPNEKDSPLQQSLTYTDKITLKHNQNTIRVDFSSFNYADNNSTKYSYMLVNYDKTWSMPTSLNFADYKMLPPGSYELQVRSGSSSGVWSDQISKLSITIKPPFYKTAWAFLIYALFILTVAYFTFNILRNFYRLNNKIALEKQLTDYKLMFFTNISHEFRTPLTLIQGSLDRIRRLNIPSKELVPAMQTMEKSTNRLLRLIDQLLEFRKMQNNKLALSLEKTDAVAFLQEIFYSFNDMAESKNMDFRFLPSTPSLNMYIDKGKVDKIVYNMLSNAFKYTPQGGKITLSVNENQDGKTLDIRVIDSGVGIPKEKRNELFNRFMQSNYSGESVGIGLHLAHELVQVHKGEISYDENAGEGSIFTVKLPLGKEVYEEKDFLIADNALMQEKNKAFVSEELNQEEVGLLLTKTDPLNKQQLLVIEDDPDVRQYLIEELSHYFTVLSADNGISGFQMAQDENIDLIVCDVMMPGMNGYEVVKKLKNEFKTSHIPVILLTALSLPENELEGIESGAEVYLSKPFSTRLLLTHIIKLLEQRERLKEKFSTESGFVRTTVYTTDRDKDFVDQLDKILEKRLADPKFSVDDFASLMNIGRTIFYRKVKGLTGYSPNEYIRIVRMKKAAEYLQTTNHPVADVAFMVGIEDPFYFSKCFKTQFGVAPTVYRGKPKA
ncbi:response regulator [Bacteroidales bacterium OttesenSCG-928-L03]|nr:response regulator [Bacteroidales bacterium OttesenSCG-928-L03]